MIANRCAIPHQPLTPAKVRPAPTKADRPKKAGDTVSPSTTPASTSEPAAIWTCRMISSGAPLFSATGNPALRQASSPPSM